MNRTILKLYTQACYHGDYEPENVPKEVVEKFAELIVRECVSITDGLSKLYPRTDVSFDVGYTMGTARASKEIKQHFGVEE